MYVIYQMQRKWGILLVLILSQMTPVWAQEEGVVDPDSSGVVSNRMLPTSTPILLFSDRDEEVKEKKKQAKKKERKNFYFGERTSRNVIRTSFRDQTTVQLFNTTQRNQKVDAYIRDIYWYDSRAKAIKNRNFDPSRGYLLHGPYEKRINDVVVESGMYYYGTKHGRWMTFDGKSVLVDKSYFYQGWPRESRITYYNREQKAIERLTPIEYDLEEGNYYHFFPGGQVAVIGEYRYGERVGLWTEFWESKGDSLVRKREIQYQPTPFMRNFRPFIRAEWDKEGNLIYRNDG
ncbi:hypothetical protein ADIS_2496 [Lunatimonas lonarensis]|uniref:Exported 24-amino acid repeat protein n=1 Tax=Lunatimonas lonarensis TaxID=1232681 RepID=R7ZSI4_9BACT|nr:hypothetical protein [Lunatimonas lonarensis]EON77047.1 hypothetical protein ADIS_2496 [Lunatimonas lonarensis]